MQILFIYAREMFDQAVIDILLLNSGTLKNVLKNYWKLC